MRTTAIANIKAYLTLGFLIISLLGFSQSPSTFISSGTWVCPNGVTSITVEAYGAGGGGGYGGGSNKNGGGGGGGGAFTRNTAVPVTPGVTYSITIGSGGSGGNSSTGTNANGTNGANTTFGTATVVANGGSGGRGYNNTPSGGNGGTGGTFAGGNGGTGSNSGSGGGGGCAGTSTAGGNGALPTKGNKGTGGTIAGDGAVGSTSNSVSGANGSDFGGGGSGGTKNSTGGDGADGYMVITFNCPTLTVSAGSNQTICATTATLAASAIPTATTGSWSVVSGSATFTSPNSPTSGVTALGNGANVLRWTINNGRCGNTSSTVTITRSSAPTIVINPTPNNLETGVCYSGSGARNSVTWDASVNATSYDVYFGAGSLPTTVTANVTTNSYTTGTLLANTTYFWKVIAKNASCPASGVAYTWTFTTASTACSALNYCIPSSTSIVDGTGITNVSFSTTVNNTTSDTGVYNNYSATHKGNVVQGSQMTIKVTTRTKESGNNGKDKGYNIIIWVDWNNDGDFNDANEVAVPLGTVTSNTYSNIINVPANASIGNHRLRIGITRKSNNNNPVPTPCFNDNSTKAAYEDYTLNVISPDSGCTLAPTVASNPSNSTVLIGFDTSFTATFNNVPTSYVWEVCTDGGGTNFTPITNSIIYSGATTETLTITNATSGMNGFKYRVFARNACGKSNNSTLALLTVTTPSYCNAFSTSNTYWIANFSSLGNLNDTSKTSTYSTGGYADYSSTTIATQIPGGGMNFSITLGTTILPSTGVDRQMVACYVDWNGDGDFNDEGEIVYSTGNLALAESTFGFVVPETQELGNYRMRVRSKKGYDSTPIVACNNYTTGETEDYTISVVQDCASKIQDVTNITQCGANSVALNVVGLGGTSEYRWYTSETSVTPIATTATGTWTTPTINQTTTYYVTSYNGSCESLVRTPIVITVIPTTIINFSPTEPVACGEDSILTINATGGTTVVTLFSENFEGNTIGLTPTMTALNPGADSAWSVKTNTYQSPTNYWKPAISSGEIDTNFAYTNSDYSGSNIVSQLTTTASINTTNYINLTLSFRQYFSFYSGSGTVNHAKVQVLAANGNTWVDVVGGTFTSDIGSASRFVETTIDLSAYKERTNLKIRFQYTGVFADGWAIDDIRFFGTKNLNTAFSWISPPGTTVNAYTNIACTPQYLYNPLISTPSTTIFLKPNLSQLESTTFPITITATLENNCPVSQVITVNNNTKVWRGGSATDWTNPANWKPFGVPTASNCVIVPENTVISGTNFNAFAKNVVVKSNGTFEIQAGNNLTVTDWINVNTGGVFNLRNNATIIQSTDVQNTGNVRIERITKPINFYDYTYWNSPVTATSNFTLGSLTNNSTSNIYSYSPTIAGGSGNWIGVSSSSVMVPTKGYIVKAPNTFSTNPNVKTTFTATFIGAPNNGPIYAPVSKGTNANMGTGTVANEDDEWNLIGNPYPSGLDAKKFLDLPANANVVDGTIYIWTHNTQPSAAAPDPFYGDFVLNYTSEDYAAFNKTGGTATSAASTGGSAPTGFIASGQSFFVKSANTMPNGTTTNATFNNTMRVGNNSNATTGTNSDFFKIRKNPKNATDEKHRIWLNLTNNSGAFSQTLIGYLPDATMGLDRGFDGESFGGNDVTFYSIIPDTKLSIQGRSLPFDTNDSVNLGYNASKTGNYSIRIDHVDGVFDNQDIYLEDKDLKIIHDLRTYPYEFTTEIGDFDNRFVLKYTNNYSHKTLSVDEKISTSNDIKISTIKNENKVIVNNNSNDNSIEKVILFNILGQELANWKIENQDQANIQIPVNNMSKGVYIVKLKTTKGEISKKIIL